MYSKSNKIEPLYPDSANILIKRRKNLFYAKIRRVLLIVFFICLAIFIYALFLKRASAYAYKDINKGRQIVVQSGCMECHSFIAGKRIDNIESLAGWGNKHLNIKQTEKAIRSCKADVYCSQILTDKQVKYVAYYLNSLR